MRLPSGCERSGAEFVKGVALALFRGRKEALQG